jgi:endonuclease YncB( thermonuclease family)
MKNYTHNSSEPDEADVTGDLAHHDRVFIRQPQPPPPDWLGSGGEPLTPRTGRRRRYWLCFWLGVLCGMAIVLIAEQASGQTFVQDGDSFTRDGVHFRLWGIDAPELNQTCDGRPVGQWAKRRLIELMTLTVVCQSKGTDRYGRTLAVCIDPVGRIDINRTLVEEGLAVAYTRYTDAYKPYEGWGPVHQYHCINPEKWRHK